MSRLENEISLLFAKGSTGTNNVDGERCVRQELQQHPAGIEKATGTPHHRSLHLWPSPSTLWPLPSIPYNVPPKTIIAATGYGKCHHRSGHCNTAMMASYDMRIVLADHLEEVSRR